MIGHPLKVSALLEEITQGAVVLPEIQRSYVWRGPQVAQLIDSLYHEYPSGQILLWDTAELPISRSLDGVSKPTLPTVGNPKIVLDGQQRLTSLYKALGPKAPDGVEVYFNVETEQFQRFSSALARDPLWVSVRDVVSGTKHSIDVLDAIESAGEIGRADPRRRKYADRLQKLASIGDYKFPIEIFKSDDYEEVTELFVRINSAGTRLRAAELALAQLALRLPGALVDKFDKAIEQYSDVGFDLDARFLTRAFIAIGTGQSRFRSLKEFWKKTPKELDGIWQRTRRGVDSAVNFVRQNAHFESSDWLPTLNALIPLSSYFERHKNLTPDVEESLLRWFYVASLRGRYSGSGETAMDEDLKAVTTEGPVTALMKNVAPSKRILEVLPDEFDDAGAKNPLFALSYAAARKAGAKDWFTGVALSTHVVGDDHEIEVHHVFPKALLNEQKVSRQDRDEIANLAFLTARPNKTISRKSPHEYLRAIADKHPERLTAQCIPMDRALWRVERYDEFLDERRKLLAQRLNALIKNPC